MSRRPSGGRAASTVPSVPIETSSSPMPAGTLIAGCMSAPVLVVEPAGAVDVQAAVARERLAAVGEPDAEEALALDRHVERAVGALQEPWANARPASTAAAPEPVRTPWADERPVWSYTRSRNPTRWCL